MRGRASVPSHGRRWGARVSVFGASTGRTTGWGGGGLDLRERGVVLLMLPELGSSMRTRRRRSAMVLLVVFKMRFRAIVSALRVGARERRRRHWHARPDRHVRSRAGRASCRVVFLMQLEMSSTVHAHRRRSVVLLLVVSEMSSDMRRACARPELARLHAEQVLQELLLGLEENLDRARRGKQCGHETTVSRPARHAALASCRGLHGKARRAQCGPVAKLRLTTRARHDSAIDGMHSCMEGVFQMMCRQ